MSKKKDTKAKKSKEVLDYILDNPFPVDAIDGEKARDEFLGVRGILPTPPFNPYKPPENKQVGVMVVTGGCYKDFGNQHKKTAFPEFARWKWQTIIERHWLVVFHEEDGEEIIDAQFPAEDVVQVLGPTTLIRDKEW